MIIFSISCPHDITIKGKIERNSGPLVGFQLPFQSLLSPIISSKTIIPQISSNSTSLRSPKKRDQLITKIDSNTMADQATGHRVVAVPYPGRGHINPMMNFCKSMASKRPDLHILVIVTQEWLGYLNSDDDEDTSIGFATIPNVLPSEASRGSDLPGFLDAVQTEMEGPVEKALDAIGAPVDVIIADSFLGWAVDVGRRRNTQVASFWPASVSTFLLVHHHDLVQKLLAGSAEERIEMPGIPSIRRVDLPGSLQPNNRRLPDVLVKVVSSASEAQCIIFRSLEELEAPAIRALKADLSCPIYTTGPAIPYSSSQMDELAAGLEASGVPFLWVAKGQISQFSDRLGMVVPWCDQMRVLCHPSIGGFFTHCGWNSTLETAFAGVPALTFPLGADQVLNSKVMVEDWGIGWRVKDTVDELVRSEAISTLLKRFMDLKCSERKELDRTSKELQARLLGSVRGGGIGRNFNRFVSQMIRTSEMDDD